MLTLSTTRYCVLCIHQLSKVVRSKRLLTSSSSSSVDHAHMRHVGGRSPCAKHTCGLPLGRGRERPGSPICFWRLMRCRSRSRCAVLCAGFLPNHQPFSSTTLQSQPTGLLHSWNALSFIRTDGRPLAFTRISKSGGRHNGCLRRWSPPLAEETPMLFWQ